MKYIALALLFAGSVESANIDPKANNPVPSHADVIESGFAVPGNSVYSWVTRQMGHSNVGPGFRYQFHLASGSQLVSTLDLINQTKPNGKTVVNGIPVPGYTPDGIPSTTTGTDSCYQFTLGTVQATANVVWVWTYQYRSDSNGDGTNDSNPGWELTSFTMTNINLVENGAIGC